jgi:hypothetical protein
MDQTLLLERLARGLLTLVAVACIGNALFMIIMPMQWYAALPSVQATGPANGHLIVDVGIAYLCSGVLLAYGAWSPAIRAGAVMAGVLWLAAHSVVHIVECLRGDAPVSRFLVDAPAVLGPPLVVITPLAVLRVTRKPRRKRI